MAEAKWPNPHSMLGAFQLLDLLGRGGMGRVYRAKRTRTDVAGDVIEEEVALKVLDPVLAQRKTVRDFFFQEAELGRGLAHPNLVAFLDAGEAEGLLFLAFEYIHGVSLDQIIKKHGAGLPPELACSVLEDVTFGIAAAHQRGIVHRDLKPQNVMITPDNVIKVIDFGLADASGGVEEGRTVGTPVYAAPEQNLGKKTGPSADIYSLGLLAYEMFSGSRLLRTGGAADVLKAVLGQQIKLQKVLESGVSLNKNVPAPLNPVLRKMLEFKPSDRYQSAGEVAVILEQVLPKRQGKSNEALAKSKAEAVAELADTHYWKALEAARQKDFTAASAECARLVALRPPALARLKEALSSEVVAIAWDPALGGAPSEGEKPPAPDLAGLEGLAKLAGAAGLPELRWVLQARLARMSRSCSPGFMTELLDRSQEAIPVLQQIFRDPKSPDVDRARVAVPLAWALLGSGFPEQAKGVVTEGLKLTPGNPALLAAQQKCQDSARVMAEAREALVAMKKIAQSQPDERERVNKIVAFAEKHPYLAEARNLQIEEARKHGFHEAATDAYVALGIRELVKQSPGLGRTYFLKALETQPQRTDVQFFLVEGMRHAGRGVRVPKEKDGRTRTLLRWFGIHGPLVKELEGQLSGKEGDREILKELAALAAEHPEKTSPTRWLVQLAGLEIRLGNLPAAKQIFDQALGVSVNRNETLAEIRAVPGIDRAYNRLELARLASEGT